MGIKEDLNLIHTQLGASKTKERKDGVSSLKTFVQSRAKEGTLAPKTWSVIVAKLFEAVDAEYAHQSKSKKGTTKSFKSDISEPTKLIINTLAAYGNVGDNADSPTSSTESRNLLQTNCIKLIQQQALASLQDTGKRENFGVAYSDVLRNLAANRYYALKIDTEFFKSLFETLADLLTKEEIDQSEGVQYSLTLESLLRCYPKDVATEHGKDIVEFFTTFFSDRRGGTSTSADRVNLNILRALYRFAGQNAADLSSSIVALAEKIVSRLIRIWLDTHQDLVKIGVIQFLRVVLRLYQIESKDCPFIGDLLEPVTKDLNSARLFNQHTKNITDREKFIQDERRGVFMDLAADVIFTILLSTQQTITTDGTPRNKRRRVAFIEDEMLQNIPKREQLDSETLDEKSGNWLALIYALVKTHGKNMSVDLLVRLSRYIKDLFEIRPSSRLLMDGRLRQITTMVHSNAALALESICVSLSQQKVLIDEFWDRELPEVVIKYIAIEIKEQEVMRHVLSLMSSIIRYRNASLPSTLEQSLMSVPFFQDPRNVCNEALELISTIQTISKTENSTRKVHAAEDTIQWMFAALKQKSNERAAVSLANINPELFSNTLLSLIKTQGYTATKDTKITEESEDAFIEQQLNRLSEIVNPFSEQLQQSTNVASNSYDSELLNAIASGARSRSDEYINDPVTDDSKKKRKGVAQYVADRVQYIVHLSTILLGLLTKWSHLAQIDQDIGLVSVVTQLMNQIPVLLSDMTQDTSAWSLVMQPLAQLLRNTIGKVHLTSIEDSLTQIEVLTTQVVVQINSQITKAANDAIKSTRGLNDSDSDMNISNDDDFMDSQNSNSNSTPPSNIATISVEAKQKMVYVGLSMIPDFFVWLPSLENELIRVVSDIHEDASTIDIQFEACARLAMMDSSTARGKCMDMLPTRMADERSFAHNLRVLKTLAQSLKGKPYYNDEDTGAIGKSEHLLLSFKGILSQKDDKLPESVRVEFIECVNAFMQINDERFVDLGEIIPDLLDDHSYLVREAACKALPTLLSNSKNMTTIFARLIGKIDKMLLSTSQSDTKSRSALLALDNLARMGVLEIEQRSILTLCRLYVDSVTKNLLKDVLTHVALYLRYPSLVQLLEEHLPYLWHEWIVAPFPVMVTTHSSKKKASTQSGKRKRLEDDEDDDEETTEETMSTPEHFPYSLFGIDFMSTFVERYGDVVVPTIVGECNKELLQSISNGSDKALLEKYFAPVYAYCVLKRVSGTNDAERFLSDIITKRDLTNILTKQMDYVIVSMIWSLSTEDYSGNQLLFSQATITEGLKSLTTSGSSIASLFKATKGRIQAILLAVHFKLLGSHRVNYRQRSLAVLEAVVTIWMGDANLKIASVLRSVIHILLNFIKKSIELMKDSTSTEKNLERSLQESACSLLLTVLESSQKDSEAEEIREIGKNARKIQTLMVEIVIERLRANMSHTQTQAYSVLSRLFARPTPSLRDAIKKIGLDAFPKDSCFSLFQETYYNLQKEEEKLGSLSSVIQSFISSEGSVGLSRLSKAFQKSEKDLQALVSMKAQAHIYSLFSQISTKLLMICREEMEKSKRNSDVENGILKQASQCLTTLVLLGVEQGGGESEFDVLFSITDQISSFTPDDVAELSKVKVLQLLDSYLNDTDVTVISEASYVLQKVLNTTQGKTAFQAIMTDADLKLYLQPYLVQWQCKTTTAVVPPAHTYVPWSNELFSRDNKDHAEWVKHVTYSLIINGDVSDEMLCACAPLCLYKTSMAELLFPLCVLDMSTNKTKSKDYALQLAKLLNLHVLSLDIAFSEDLGRTIRLILSTLNIMHRQHRQKVKKGALRTDSQFNYWLPIPYSVVARAALKAGTVFTALLFAEMSFETDNLLKPLSSEIQFEGEVPQEQDLLIDIYRNIDEPDGMDGINRNFGIRSQLMRYEHQGNWQSALGTFDVTSLQNNHGSYPLVGAFTALKNMGYHHTSKMFVEGLAHSRDQAIAQHDLDELKFETAWREFSTEYANTPTSNQYGFNEQLYRMLCALSTKDTRRFTEAYNTLEPRVINALITSTATGIHASAARLRMLTEMKQAWEIGSTNSEWLVGSVGVTDDTGFDQIEPILSLRKSLLQAVEKSYLVPEHLCKVASLARKQGRLELASNIIRNVSILCANKTGPWMLEDARILWKRGESDLAISIAKFLITKLKSEDTESAKSLLGEASRLCGKWLGHTGSISSHHIIDDYLKVATVNCDEKYKAFYTLARYTDQLYQMLIRKVKSEEYKTSRRLREQNEKLLRQYQSHLSSVAGNRTAERELQRQIEALNKSVTTDQENELRIKSDTAAFLKGTLTNYGLTAQTGDKHDLHVIFRVVSLWFNNSDTKEINVLVFNLLKDKKIPARKFLPLIYQIASRLSVANSPSMFEKAILSLVKHICTTHPQQSLYQVFALMNGDKVAAGKEKSRHQADTDKIQAAKQVIDNARNSEIKQVVDETEKLIDAYIELAFIQLDQKKYRNFSDPVTMNPKLLIRQINNLTKVAIPTIESESITATLPTVVSFESAFRLAGGINLPKIVKCTGSDGKQYRQLVKGRDDMRQDAVMQQIFSLVNKLLIDERETYHKKLRVRTYKVIPLTPDSGILGWVEHTTPMAEWLTGPNKNQEMGAHRRYRPFDSLYIDSRATLQKGAQLDNDKKLKNFLNVCAKFQPVMHHFFSENFVQPHEWFYKRLNFQRSVASNSIVGYIMGIGDRHAHNILLDMQTAECIHIDLGVAFEQGKLLPTPEQVPFRLTRDIVDGFGVTGVEGVFRRSSEATMSVLRRHADLITLIVEVFIHDPLYKWSLSPLMALNVQRLHGEDDEREDNDLSSTDQQQSNEVKNRDAEGALVRLREKLQGYEEGELLGVKGQVDKLIREATDAKLLSQMFHGWSSFL